MSNYYNEFDRYAAKWLRNLISAGHIAPGDVDERSILEVRPDDLRGYRQCHFFAGIGGWSYAMRLAGWPDDRPVWTGSCPCQPFSSAGAQRGSADERHLWPTFSALIRELGPRTVFGEQVAGAAGAAWWDHVAADLEEAGYAAAAANLGAHSVGAPHIRQRLYWVAHGHQSGRSKQRLPKLLDGQWTAQRHDVDRCGAHGGMGFAEESGPQEREGTRAFPKVQTRGLEQASPWGRVEWVKCSGGKRRPVEPGTCPLAHGIPNRVGRLRAYGNAIVPLVAAAFVMAATAH